MAWQAPRHQCCEEGACTCLSSSPHHPHNLHATGWHLADDLLPNGWNNPAISALVDSGASSPVRRASTAYLCVWVAANAARAWRPGCYLTPCTYPPRPPHLHPQLQGWLSWPRRCSNPSRLPRCCSWLRTCCRPGWHLSGPPQGARQLRPPEAGSAMCLGCAGRWRAHQHAAAQRQARMVGTGNRGSSSLQQHSPSTQSLMTTPRLPCHYSPCSCSVRCTSAGPVVHGAPRPTPSHAVRSQIDRAHEIGCEPSQEMDRRGQAGRHRGAHRWRATGHRKANSQQKGKG